MKPITPTSGVWILALMGMALHSFASDPQEIRKSSYARWSQGPSKDPGFFPIAVWLQDPRNAERFRKAGINTYVGLWKGPTEEQLSVLKKAGMRVICEQNETGLGHLQDDTIIGWMHGDEPDNAQPLRIGVGYGPPIEPAKIQENYLRIQKQDPTRPVLLNLGQGVAYDNYIGRGVRRNHMEDYPEYVKGGDIVSFDIYPVVHDQKEIAGQLWYVPRGVERLVEWTRGKKVVWNCLECTRIGNPDRKATPAQVRSEAWMSIIHGSMGLIYFVHEWKPRFREAAILEDPEMLAGITQLNAQIAQLAPVINSATAMERVTVTSSNPEVPIATLVKHHGGQTYLFTVAMRKGETTAHFTLSSQPGETEVKVIGENRTIQANREGFEDRFSDWAVHLYQFRAAQ